MATPRVFVSSTCIDFQETRRQLRQFIIDHGFEPVMSEFHDIFYDFDTHVQDACKAEIDRCNLFILIVGNQYGSVYYKERANAPYPDSVTIQEFRKALETQIPKHIFIDKFVKHDYDNYTHARDDVFTKHFQTHEVEAKNIESVKQQLRQDFDGRYPFPQTQYKYIFYFLDLIHELETNNAIIPFETFDDIRNALLTQWAGLMYEALERRTKVPASSIVFLESKIEKIESYMEKLLATKEPQKGSSTISFDLSKFTSSIEIDQLEALKEKIDNLVTAIFYDGNEMTGFNLRGGFHSKPTLDWSKKWVFKLPGLLKKYKWSRTIKFTVLFAGTGLFFYKLYEHIPYRTIFEFNQLYENMGAEEKDALLTTLIEKAEVHNPSQPPPSDDIPF